MTGATPSINLSSGNYRIVLSVSNTDGYSDTDTVSISVLDTIAPVPSVASLPVIRSQCQATITTIPTAVDNCSGIIAATTSDPKTYNLQGTYTINWVYKDVNGNTSTQKQTVIIRDTIAPVPETATLPTLISECSVNAVTPYAIDECSGRIQATSAGPVTFQEQGVYQIIWKYTDNAGNSSTQVQNVIVKDTTPPVPSISKLPDLYGECSVTLNRPLANDNCAGIINGITATPLLIDQQGAYDVNWTYDDGHGNIVTQVQHVIVKDSLAPKIIIPHDTTVIISSLKQFASIGIDTIKAFDNCTVSPVIAMRSDGLSLNDSFPVGTTLISWKACDNHGNCDSVMQKISVFQNRVPAIITPHDTSMNEGDLLELYVTASDSDLTIPKISLINPPAFMKLSNIGGATKIDIQPGCADNGVYTVTLQASDGIDSVQTEFHIKVNDINFAPVFSPITYQLAREQQPYTLNVKVNDCDGTIPRIKMVNLPKGSHYTDNLDGQGTFTWTPGGDDNGFYVVIFEATDGSLTVRDTVVIEVADANCYTPKLTVTDSVITSSINLPITILASSSDSDGVPPLLSTSLLPIGAKFTTDESNGTGVFTWSPKSLGTYTFTITATDVADSLVKVSKSISIIVNNNNITGPVFEPCHDTTIEQNTVMHLHIEAHDLDGTIPEFYLISGPSGVRVEDNHDGTGFINWNPDCATSGVFKITVGTKDQSIADTLNVNVTVRDVNCSPIINNLPDISANPGEMIKVIVSAYDPDNDGSVPVLSADCDIPGFTFVTLGNGKAEFRCNAPVNTGIYQVKFQASDGVLSDYTTMNISVNKFGSVKICGTQSGVKIYSMPAGCYSGKYIGQDSITFTAAPGMYWFEAQMQGFRAQRFACKINADIITTQSITLKPKIPLMFCYPETLSIKNTSSVPAGDLTFADINGDQIEDLLIAAPGQGICYAGVDSLTKNSYQPFVSDFDEVIKQFDPLHIEFVDWDDNGKYDCVLSDKSGKIVVIYKNGTVDTLVNIANARLYPIVFDINKDNKKDLLVNNEGIGLYEYTNIGTDSLPVISFSGECRDSSGQTITDFKGAPVLTDIDGDSKEEFVISSGGLLKVYAIDSSFTKLTYKELLNCGGKKITGDTLSLSIIGAPFGNPKLAIRNNNGKTLIYSSHLLGDINNDCVVDIKDISRISKELEYHETDSGYTPLYNLHLSETGNESIDIRDISKASKCWEMQE